MEINNRDVLKISNICDNYIKNNIEFIKTNEIKNVVDKIEVNDEKENKVKSKLKLK